MKLDEIPARTEGGFHVVIESPRSSIVKLKYEPELGVITVSRALPLGFAYPYDWGFVPSTKAPDGDPVDALVYWDVPSVTGAVLRCRLLGVLRLDQKGEGDRRQRNDRIIAVPLGHERGVDVASVNDLAERVRDELAHFFTSQVYFMPKDPKVLGWGDAREAERIVDAAARAAKRAQK
jgi:inorganic pyrophosphatase